MEYAMWLIFMIWNSILDIRKKEISLGSCMIFALLAVVRMIVLDMSIYTVFLSGIPGLLLMAVSICSRAAVGFGDGIVVLITGWILGTERTVQSLFYGLLLSAIVGGIQVFVGKKGREEELPFVPYLLTGGVIVLSLSES